MTDARGIYLRKMDKKGRIFINGPMRRYFGMEKGVDSGAICNIGFPRESATSALILINDPFADELSEKTRSSDLENFDVVTVDNDPSPFKRIQDQFRPVEIKSNRIQFNKYERRRLNLPKGDSRVFVQGGGVRFVMWSASEFQSKFPDLYERFSEVDEDDED
jgi:DNA-binding transcriptional regulator/RsmH inhibitor MraZ